MTETTDILRFRRSGEVDDPPTALARDGARRTVAEALAAEADAFVAGFAEARLKAGRRGVARHGFGPERTVQTGVGPVQVRRPKVRDREPARSGEQVRFTSAILPRWARRTKSLDALLPVLPLRGVSTGDVQEALAAIPGKDAPNLSPSGIGRLKARGERNCEAWRRRDLAAKAWVHIWADGVHLQARLEPEAEGMVVIGATPEGRKERVGFQGGRRESARSWRELRVDLKARGLSVAPELAVGDGALGFWTALETAFPWTRHRRCWVHKLSTIPNRLPKPMASQVKADLRDVRQAESRAAAEVAIDVFVEKRGVKCDKAAACPTKDREALLAFFDFPAEPWDHLRAANPIESVFATVRHRTTRTKGAPSQTTARIMVFALLQSAARKWRRLKGENRSPQVIEGVRFQDGAEATGDEKKNAA